MLAQGQTKQLRSSLDILALHRCLVTNPYGSTNSSAASLTVTNANTPPAITEQPSHQFVARRR